MELNSSAKKILVARNDLKNISNSQKELSFEHKSGRQIAVSMESKTALRVWIEAKSENEFQAFPHYKYYPRNKSRAHLAAGRLAQGRAAWYVKLGDIGEFSELVESYLGIDKTKNTDDSVSPVGNALGPQGGASDPKEGAADIATEFSSYPEGIESYKLHRTLERDTSLALRAKKKRLDEAGELKCDVCEFDFSLIFGSLGLGYIEAHHTVPVAELKGERVTAIEELALVCANCHRMLHRGSKLLTVAGLKEIIGAESKKT